MAAVTFEGDVALAGARMLDGVRGEGGDAVWLQVQLGEAELGRPYPDPAVVREKGGTSPVDQVSAVRPGIDSKEMVIDPGESDRAGESQPPGQRRVASGDGGDAE